MKRYNTPHRSRVIKTRLTGEEYSAPYNALSSEVRAAISKLAALKFEVLKKVGEAVGDVQTYQF